MNFSELKAEQLTLCHCGEYSDYKCALCLNIEKCEHIVKDAIDKKNRCFDSHDCLDDVHLLLDDLKQEIFGTKEVGE